MRDSTDQALASAIRRLRHKRGTTQEALALNAGMTVAALSRIERGQADPRWTTVRRITGGLEISLAELVGEVGDAAV